MRNILLLFLIVHVSYSFSQNFIGVKITDKPAPNEHVLDIQHMKIEPQFDLKNEMITGKVTHTFEVLRPKVEEVFFHGEKMKIASVKRRGKDLKYTVSDTGIVVSFEPALTWGTIDSIEINYACKPYKGLYFIGWNDPTGRNRKQIWTQGEGEDNRHWIPMYDKPNDKMTTEMILDFDSKYKVLSNGTLISSNKKGENTRWHYRMKHPHASYLVMLGIGEYEIEKRKSKSGVPVSLYYYPDHKDRVKWSYKYSTECIDFLEEQTGIPFPWESYANIPVQDFMYGAMENTTATIFGDFSMTDARAFYDRNYINTNVHELTHQWFGDLITNYNWDHLWLQESFATFYPKMFQRKYFGEDQYEWMRRGEQNSALGAGKRNSLPIVHLNSGSERVYSKGSTVLDMMHYLYGEDVYKKVIQAYLKKNSYKNVSTYDLIKVFYDEVGISPDWFFEQWIFKGGEPHYKVSYQEVQKEGLFETQIQVDQIQAQNESVGLFKMPIDIEVYYTDGKKDSKKVWIEKINQTVIIPNDENKTLAYVLFDPGSYVLKNIDFKKGFDELSLQAKNASHFIDRYDAIVAMKNASIEKKRELLIARFDKEKHQAIKSEIISQLSGDNHPNTIDLLKKAISDPQAEVRGAVISNVQGNAQILKDKIEKALQDSSYQNIGYALDVLISLDITNKESYLKQTKDYYGIGNKFRVKWLEYYYQLPGKQEEAMKELVDYTSESFDFNTRKNAMEALVRQGYVNNDLIKNSTQATFSTNSRLANPMKEMIKTICKNINHQMMYQSYWTSGKWNDREQKIVDSILRN